MSLIFDGEVTSLMPQTEVSGPMQDSEVAAHHFASIAGGVFNGNSVTYDGVNDSTTSDTRDGTDGVLITATGDFTLYMNMVMLSAIGSVNERWIRPVTLGSSQGPLISPSFSTALGRINFLSFAEAASPNLNLEMGRDFNVNEEVLVIMSQDFSAKIITCVVRSLDGLDLSGQDSGTGTPLFGAADSYLMFSNTIGGFSHLELKEMGAINGTFKTLEQIEAAGEAWANPPLAPPPAGDALFRGNSLYSD